MRGSRLSMRGCGKGVRGEWHMKGEYREYKVRVGESEYTVRVTELLPGKFKVVVEGEEIEVEVEHASMPQAEEKVQKHVSLQGREHTTAKTRLPVSNVTTEPAVETEDVEYTVKAAVVEAPVPGKVLKVLVKPGETVDKKTVLLTLESMKMELEVYPPRRGVVKRVLVKPGDFVDSGSKLVIIE